MENHCHPGKIGETKTTNPFPSALPGNTLKDHDYNIAESVGYERTFESSKSKSGDQNRVSTSVSHQSNQIQSVKACSVNIKNCTWTASCTANSIGASSFSNQANCPGSFSICVPLPVSQSDIKFMGNTEISLCLLNQTGESSSLLTPGWKDGQSKCALKVKTLIEDFDKHIKNPIYHFSVMEKYIVETFKIASKASTKNPLSPHKILIEPCILSLRAITKIYKTGTNFSLPASKYYFMFLLDRFLFIRKEVRKIRPIQKH